MFVSAPRETRMTHPADPSSPTSAPGEPKSGTRPGSDPEKKNDASGADPEKDAGAPRSAPPTPTEIDRSTDA